MTIGIYKITNKVNNKCYIGQSVNVENRIKGHVKELVNNKHKNKHLQSSFNKYGFMNFTFEMLLSCKEAELDKIEESLIIKYKCYLSENGYNHMIGNFYNSKKISFDDISEIIDIFKKDINTDIGTVAKKYNISKSYIYGILKENNLKRKKVNTLETREKLSKSLKGRKMSAQHYNNVKIANQKAHGHTKTTEDQIRMVINLLLEGKTNKEIEKETGCSYTTVNSVRHKKCWKGMTMGIEFPKVKDKQLALNETQAKEIINLLLNKESIGLIAKKYNVSNTVIYNIKTGKTWKHLTENINL